LSPVRGLTVSRRRLDLLVVERGLSQSREQARLAILGGRVRVNGEQIVKPAREVEIAAVITLAAPPRFVGRGGEKLDHAFNTFGLDPKGLVAADVGASTGGFTDCLLQHGAARVYAIDVGYGQLDYRLRVDQRVVVMERVNARMLPLLPEPIDLLVADLSFISLTLALPSPVRSLRPDGRLILLVKPQFEARRGEVGKGGVIRDAQLHAAVLGRFARWLTTEGYRILGLTASPILGASGNREFLMHCAPPRIGV
jgi:23S rRNA (cytidine1920-2'-O)/16S rRNA (cytidine1409-2'-O)-methyltransferase